MGHLAKSLFGKDKIGSIGVVLAGTNKKEFEKKILSYFDKTLNFKDSVYHAYLARKNNIDYPIVFNVYGAPAMIDVMTEMHDGGCRTIIFVGYAYGGFKNINIGSVVVPNQAYHFDGIYHGIRLDNRSKGIHEKDVKNTRNNAKTKVVKVIIDNINNFKLKPLKGKKFDLDKHS